MFRGHNGLELTGDSLKISFRESEKWPQLTPGGTIRAYIFDIGDEASGPNIQLGNIQPMPDEKLDWRHSIVDLLKLLALDSSLTARIELANELGYHGSTDSTVLNPWLHKRVLQKLAENGGKLPDELRV